MDRTDDTLGFIDVPPRRETRGKALVRGDTAPSLLGSSESIRTLRMTIANIATRGSMSTVLIVGPTGSGKELIATSLWLQSQRAKRPFVRVNCAAIPRPLFESEMFGHERGAFTGATERKPGLFESATDGVLLLDEIGDMPLEHQGKMLRALESKSFLSVGSTKERSADVWIIAATNADLQRKVCDGEFREDLYYRLNILPLYAPPLSERREDIGLLAQAFGAQLEMPKTFAADALRWLEGRPWPGNVRELKAFIDRLDIFCPAAHVTRRDLLDADAMMPSVKNAPTVASSSPGIRKAGASFDETMDDLALTLVTAALEECYGNQAAAARRVGISRNRFAAILKKSR